MVIIAAVIIVFVIPYIWMAWSGIDVKNGKREKMEWKKPAITFLIISGISLAINFYYYQMYHLNFFPNLFESMVTLIVTGAFLVVFIIVNILAGIVYKNAPKSFHNPKVMWIFTAVFCLTVLFFGSWVFPFGQKSSYVVKVEAAMQELSETEEDTEVSVLFLSSEQNCIRRRTSGCVSEEYQNVFFVKNNLDEEKEVQVRIRALDFNQNELKVVDSKIMTLGAEELRMVETEETSDKTSIWNSSTFETEQRTQFYEYQFRFREPE
ncbi:hypothetical protein P6709_15555 [Jeotgalibacillus sp. ET6]|uniref:hypothetical protein n=1 Tax=Jeotgalibacillus sp. ET6 TaxID=3037260 RepID=UPI0024187CC7|nr:hypothetical protein [Jeotgalibacillus sp. ET6]MDG5473169.1 hypothetical protein [Jeotgalibacillus sp. ET6]